MKIYSKFKETKPVGYPFDIVLLHKWMYLRGKRTRITQIKMGIVAVISVINCVLLNLKMMSRTDALIVCGLATLYVVIDIWTWFKKDKPGYRFVESYCKRKHEKFNQSVNDSRISSGL